MAGCHMNCTRCEGTGFLNVEQIPHELADAGHEAIAKWANTTAGHDVTFCDCCGNGEEWYGTPGQHYGSDDPPGPDGPYAGNGGHCHCH